MKYNNIWKIEKVKSATDEEKMESLKHLKNVRKFHIKALKGWENLENSSVCVKCQIINKIHLFKQKTFAI